MAKKKKAGSVKTSNIVTKKELEREKGALEPPDPVKTKSSKKIAPKEEQVVYQFECPFAPNGKSRVSFDHEYQGQKYKYIVELENKVYTLPEFFGPQDVTRYRKALIDNNFVEITKSRKGVIKEKKTGKYIYKAVHPEHTMDNRINRTIAMVIFDDQDRPIYDKDGKQKTEQVEIINGLVKTYNVGIYQALIRSGFLDAGKVEETE